MTTATIDSITVVLRAVPIRPLGLEIAESVHELCLDGWMDGLASRIGLYILKSLRTGPLDRNDVHAVHEHLGPHHWRSNAEEPSAPLERFVIF